jgi:succinate dehydrogenase/fumarate reductase flavoprotein subunit
MTYEIKFGFPTSGVFTNEKAETSMKGLYAAGDESFGGISGAAVFGWIAGENAAQYSRNIESANGGIFQQKMDEKKAFLEEILARESGADWKEVNIALQQVMYDYAGHARSETMLKAGLAHLKRLKEKAGKIIKAGNQHELMRCLEVLNLMDVGEAVILSARERKESRGMHARPDYPYTNPLLSKLLIIKQENSKPVIEWREIGP